MGGDLVSEVFKLKGISITAGAQEVVNPETLFQLAEDPSEELKVPQSTFRKDLHKGRLVTASFYKRLAFSSNKRYIPHENNLFMDSFPYGYVR